MSREWWNSDPVEVEDEAKLSGGLPNVSHAFTVNGQPGDLYNCSSSGTTNFSVEQGKTYLLRLVNATVNNHLFFKIASHNLTVVAVDASYTKPYTTDILILSSGQTTDILLTVNQAQAKYSMAAKVYTTMPETNFNTTTTAILSYVGSNSSATPIFPELPLYNDTATVATFTRALRSLASKDHPVDVPKSISDSSIIAVGLAALVKRAGTNIFQAHDHPLHIHGYDFYIVGEGFGNCDNEIDPLSFNLVDPPRRNTVGVLVNGWAAIRFKADNPGFFHLCRGVVRGAWFVHCHFDDHVTWGLDTVFIVKNGLGALESLIPPPPELPEC
ncbi:hypothetical protein SUGI_0962090 [Cryptomeria japonica]|nr:hypothetical protein SUGI_0962090 [Cryptomeria japonica]